MYDRLDAVDVEGIVRYVVALQQEDGSFYGENFCCLNLSNGLHSVTKVKIMQITNF